MNDAPTERALPIAEALARAVSLADARIALDRTRGLARWRTRRLLARAGRELGLSLTAGAAHVADRDPVGATVTLLQSAWLRLHGVVVPPSLDLRAATATRYWNELGRPRPWRGRWALRAVVMAAAIGIAIAVWPRAAAEPWRPPVSDGPLATLSAEREAEWVDALSDWVIDLDRLARARHAGDSAEASKRFASLAESRGAVLADDVRARFGDPVMNALGVMLSAGEAAADGGSGWEDREEAYAEAVRATNRALYAAGLGYFFDSYAVRFDDGRAEAAFFTFRIAARQRYLAGDTPIEALHLRRIDHLNLVQFLLGYTSKRMDVAVLLVDKLEEEIATRLGPALEPGHEMPLHMDAEDEGKTSWLAVRQKAGQVVREAFYGALPSEQQALSELGELLARRADLVADWNERLEHRDIELREFDSLVVEPNTRDRFEALTSREARKVLDEIQVGLETAERGELFVRLVARHARPVELHEVQHRIDYAAGDDFRPPGALLELLRIPEGSEAADSDDVRRITFELSAYTAELARDPAWARVNLTLLCEHLYDGSGGAEGWSAVAILEGLGRHLELDVAPLLTEGTGADLETVAGLHLRLLAQPGERIAGAAGKLWNEWFGHPLVPIQPVATPSVAAPTPAFEPAVVRDPGGGRP